MATENATNALHVLASNVPSLPSGQLLHTVAKHIPSALKYLALFVLALNWRSLPLVWHIRLFAPIISVRIQWDLLRLRTLFHSKKARKEARRRWLESLSPVGKTPFDGLVTYSARAGLDDCDYNFHLSNSCYAKNLDIARLKAVLAYYPGFMRAGGWSALGGTHFHFIREIPMLSRYEMRMSVECWDDKWAFFVVRFVTFPKTTQFKTKGASKAAPSTNDRATPATDAPPFPSLHTPASELGTPSASGISTPAGPITSTSSETSNMDAAMQNLATRAAAGEEADGATLNCVSVSEFVFKHGRITVPPGLVFAAEGMCARAGASRPAYSHAQPPPHWAHVQALWARGPRALGAFFRGGWREVPVGERWWEDAMGGEIEERRRAGLARVQGVRSGMEGARGLVDKATSSIDIASTQPFKKHKHTNTRTDCATLKRGARTRLPNFAQVLAQKEVIPAPITGWFLPRSLDGGRGGELSLGAPNEAKFNAATLTPPIANLDGGYWRVPVAATKVNGVAIAAIENRVGALGTASTQILMPLQDAGHVNSQLGALLDASTRKFYIPCNTDRQLSFTIANQDWAIDARDLVFLQDQRPGGFCHSMIQGGPASLQGTWILGATFMKNAYVVMNYATNEIQLARLH